MIPAHLEFRRLKQLVSIEQVLAERHLLSHLRRKRGRLVGPCPLHGGDNPSAFVVHLNRNLWHCFTRCRVGGDVVDLIRRLDHVDFRQAAHRLASLTLSSPGPVQDSHEPPGNPSFRPFTRSLPLNSCAPFLRLKGIHPATARRFETGVYSGQGFLVGCVGVRLHDPAGRPLGYAGRRLDARLARRSGKWKLPPGFPKSHMLYSLHRVSRAPCPCLVLVEGPWGVMRLSQLGVPAVALMGASLSGHQRRLLCKISRVVLLLDGDDAGLQASIELRDLLSSDADVRLVRLPDGKDPDDLADPQLAALVRPLLPS